MDDKPIERLTADELNAALAVEVMGWHIIDVARRCWRDERGMVMGYGMWRPADNAAQALQCLEALRARGWYMSGAASAAEDDWVIPLYNDRLRRDERGDGATFALALSRACLAAARSGP